MPLSLQTLHGCIQVPAMSTAQTYKLAELNAYSLCLPAQPRTHTFTPFTLTHTPTHLSTRSLAHIHSLTYSRTHCMNDDSSLLLAG